MFAHSLTPRIGDAGVPRAETPLRTRARAFSLDALSPPFEGAFSNLLNSPGWHRKGTGSSAMAPKYGIEALII